MDWAHRLLQDQAMGVAEVAGAVGYASPSAFSRAYGELKIIDERCRLDLDASTEHLAVITDPESGMTWAVPIKAIVERVIEAPDNCRMRLV